MYNTRVIKYFGNTPIQLLTECIFFNNVRAERRTDFLVLFLSSNHKVLGLGGCQTIVLFPSCIEDGRGSTILIPPWKEKLYILLLVQFWGRKRGVGIYHH